MKITVTDRAFDQLQKGGVKGFSFLRLGVQRGGCAGLSYSATIDHRMTANDDVIYEKDSLRIAADREFMHLIDGLNIDFSDDLIQPGFILKNPNAQQACGCGASFKVGEEDAFAACGGNCG